MQKRKTMLMVGLICLTLLLMITGCTGDPSEQTETDNQSQSPQQTQSSETIEQTEPAETVESSETAAPASYTVVFNINGGTLVSGSLIQTVTAGDAAVAPVVTNGTQNLSWDVDFSAIYADTIVTAIWEKNTFTVTFELNGGTLVSGKAVQSVAEGEAAVAPVVVKGNYALGWDTDFSKITSDLTVHATWTKVPLSKAEIRSLATNSTVRVSALNSDEIEFSSGSGFFIDDQGTLVTAFHVIEGARKIKIQMDDTTTVDVTEVIAFSPIYDIAILKAKNYTPKAHLTICDDLGSIQLMDTVYAVGSPLGSEGASITEGTISYETRFYGKIECFQTTAAISSGNSGGPLINEYGEVVGINAYTVRNAENMHNSIKVSMLKKIGDEVHYSTDDEFIAWYDKQVSRSYRMQNRTDETFSPTLVNTYQIVTGVKCSHSFDTEFEQHEGYTAGMAVYVYTYDPDSYDTYEVYLRSQGFIYWPDDPNPDDQNYFFLNEFSGIVVELLISDSEEYLYISVYNLYT